MLTDYRENVFPSRMSLMAVTNRHHSKQNSLRILLHKRDALDLKVRDLKQQLEMLELQKEALLEEGLLHLARARYLGTKFEPYMVAQTKKADSSLQIITARFVGIAMPNFRLDVKPTKKYQFAGLAGGGKEAQYAREIFIELLELFTSIASIKFSLITMEPALQQIKIRCNAVQYVVIPKLEATKNFIMEALDEQERENFFRLKCSKAKQIKHRQNQVVAFFPDKKINMRDFFGENEVMQPSDVNPDFKEEILKEAQSALRLQSITQPMSLMQSHNSNEQQAEFLLRKFFSKEMQTDDIYLPFKLSKAILANTMETQTDDMPSTSKPLAVVKNQPHRIHNQLSETDSRGDASDMVLFIVDDQLTWRRKRTKRTPKDWKSVQTEE